MTIISTTLSTTVPAAKYSDNENNHKIDSTASESNLKYRLFSSAQNSSAPALESEEKENHQPAARHKYVS